MNRITQLQRLLDILRKFSSGSEKVIVYPSYDRVSAYFEGHLDSIDGTEKRGLHQEFTNWVIGVHGKRSPVGWPLYIRHIMADEDEEKALKILFEQLQAFLEHLQLSATIDQD